MQYMIEMAEAREAEAIARRIRVRVGAIDCLQTLRGLAWLAAELASTRDRERLLDQESGGSEHDRTRRRIGRRLSRVSIRNLALLETLLDEMQGTRQE